MTKDFIQFNLNKTNFLLALEQIMSIESATDIHWKDASEILSGEIVINGLNIPVFNFDENLEIDNTIDPKRKICLCLTNAVYTYGILCEQVTIVNTNKVKIVDLPLSMATQNALVRNLAIKETKILSMIDTNSLGQLLDKIAKTLGIGDLHKAGTH